MERVQQDPAQTDSDQSRLYRQIYAVVRLIPVGKVATYGQIAALVGRPRHARQVGYALFRVDPNTDIPWHRVINAQGRISYASSRLGADDLQKVLLEAEGVVFNDQGTVNLKKFLWQPQVQEQLS